MSIYFERSIAGEYLEIIYLSGAGVITQRKIKVRSYNETHIIAYCLNRKQSRMFRIEQILSIAYVKPKRYDRIENV